MEDSVLSHVSCCLSNIRAVSELGTPVSPARLFSAGGRFSTVLNNAFPILGLLKQY